MKNTLRKSIATRVATFMLAFAMVFSSATVLQPAITVEAATNWSSIDSATKSTVMMQADRIVKNGSKYKKISGICNMCAVTNVLNRRLSVDAVYSSSNYFTPQYVLRITGINNPNATTSENALKASDAQYIEKYNNGTANGWLWNYDTDYYENAIFSIGKKNYKLVAWNRNDGKTLNGTLASAIDAHKEGVFVRMCNPNKTSEGHCVVFTGYTKDSKGNYTFKVLDTVSGNTSLDYSNTWNATGHKFPLTSTYVQKIMVLDSTTKTAPVIQGGTAPTPVPVVNKVSINMTSTPSSIVKGSVCNIAGKVTATSKNITSVRAYVTTTNNRTAAHKIESKYAYPNKLSYTIGGKGETVNNTLSFGNLGVGTYYLFIEAKSNGTTYYSTGYQFKVTGTPVPPTPNMVILKQGSSGYQVTALQHMLNYYGANISTDGSFGPGTKTAVINFQKSHGLSADGIVGTDTWNKLFVTQSTNNYDKNMAKAVQTLLNGKNAAGLTVDGAFGNGTKTAVINFQKKKGLDADGIVGPNTWRALLSN